MIAGLGVAMVSKLTVDDDVRRKHLAIVAMKADLPSRPVVVVDHPQKNHGAACRPTLRALENRFGLKTFAGRALRHRERSSGDGRGDDDAAPSVRRLRMKAISVAPLRVSVLVRSGFPGPIKVLECPWTNGMPRCERALASLGEECHASVEPSSVQ